MSLAVIVPVVAPAFVGKKSLRPFSKIDGREVFLRTVELYTSRDQVKQRIVVVTPDDMEEMRDRFSAHLGFQGVNVTGGGSDWAACVGRGLEKLDASIETVLIHDGCCPAVPYHLIDSLEETLAGNKALSGVVPVVPTRAGFADVEGVKVNEYVDMSKVMQVQSPQIFRKSAIVSAYAATVGQVFMDDAERVVAAGGKVMTVTGSRFNQRMDGDEMVRLGKDLIGHMPKKNKMPTTPFGEAEW